MSGFGLRIPEKKTQKPKVTNLFNVETAKDTDANTNTNTAKDTNTNTAKDTNTNTNVTTKDTNTNVTTKDTKKTSFIPDRHLVETIQQTALEEDPSIFDYDSVYEEVSTDARNKARLIRAPQEGPKYMPAILKAAEERKREQEALKIRKYRKEVTSDDQTFMTAAYKRKLEEMRQKGIEPDKSSDDEEIDRDSRDLSRFHRNIMKRDISSRSREQSPPNKKL